MYCLKTFRIDHKTLLTSNFHWNEPFTTAPRGPPRMYKSQRLHQTIQAIKKPKPFNSMTNKIHPSFKIHTRIAMKQL